MSPPAPIASPSRIPRFPGSQPQSAQSGLRYATRTLAPTLCGRGQTPKTSKAYKCHSGRSQGPRACVVDSPPPAHWIQNHRLAGTSQMRTPINSVFVRTLGVVSLTLVPVSGAMADWTQMNGGMMGNGNWYGYWWRMAARTRHCRSRCSSVRGPSQEELTATPQPSRNRKHEDLHFLFFAITGLCASHRHLRAYAQDNRCSQRNLRWAWRWTHRCPRCK